MAAARRAGAGERDVAEIKLEPLDPAEVLGGGGEDIDWRVRHRAAGHALEMYVIAAGGREVVERRAVPEVDVLH